MKYRLAVNTKVYGQALPQVPSLMERFLTGQGMLDKLKLLEVAMETKMHITFLGSMLPEMHVRQ